MYSFFNKYHMIYYLKLTRQLNAVSLFRVTSCVRQSLNKKSMPPDNHQCPADMEMVVETSLFTV